MDEGSAAGVATALRAVEVLEVISTADSPLTLSAISQGVGISIPTTRRLLKALESRDLIVPHAESKGYVLGFGIMKLARIILDRDDLVSASQPALDALRRETGETVSVQRLVDDQRIPVAELVSTHYIRMISGIGTPYPLDRGAAGKAILAFLPVHLADPIIEASHDEAALRSELKVVRRRGWARSTGEVVSGARSIAAPVFDFTGEVCASLNVTGPLERFTEEAADEFAFHLIDTAAEITRLLGGETPKGQDS